MDMKQILEDEEIKRRLRFNANKRKSVKSKMQKEDEDSRINKYLDEDKKWFPDYYKPKYDSDDE